MCLQKSMLQPGLNKKNGSFNFFGLDMDWNSLRKQSLDKGRKCGIASFQFLSAFNTPLPPSASKSVDTHREPDTDILCIF